MDWMTILGTVGGGGVLGFLNTFATGLLGIFKSREEHRQRMELGRLELDRQKLIGEQAREAAAAKQESDRERTFRDSINSLGRQNTYKWVGAVIELMRPWMTAAMLATTCYLAIRGIVAPEDCVQAVLGYTGLMIGWWFGDRQAAKYLSPRI